MDFYKEQMGNIQKQAMQYLPIFRRTLKNEGRNALIEYCHQLVDELLDKAGLWKQASCNKACSFCCHDSIFMSKLEAEYIEDIINKGNGIINKDRLNKQRLYAKAENKWVDRACPMLGDVNEDGNRPCTIYKNRPLVCRTHNSTETPKNCDRSEHPDRVVREGRVVEAEAIGIALMLLDQEVAGIKGMPKMYPLHELNI